MLATVHPSIWNLVSTLPSEQRKQMQTLLASALKVAAGGVGSAGQWPGTE
jgi:hypothetical protein